MAKVKPTDSAPVFTSQGFQVVRKTEKFSLETSTFTLGEETYFATYWRPQEVERPKGLVFICHGYGEYICPSYDEVVEKLACDGFLVFGHDHVGHGRSTGQRVQVSSIDNYVIPVASHVKKVKEDYNNEVPAFIIGHSMGGLITVYTTLAEPSLFKAVVLMGPLIQMDPDIATPLKRTLASWFKGLLPSLALGSLDASAITRDKEVVERVKADPLAWHGGFRAQHSAVLLDATDALADGQKLKEIKVPILIFQGEKDKLVFPAGAPFLHDNVSSTEKKLLTFPDAFHNLYVELDDVKSNVITETCDWIIRHV